MEEACGDTDAGSIQGYARENIACDVDEVLWPDPARRMKPRYTQPPRPPTNTHTTNTCWVSMFYGDIP